MLGMNWIASLPLHYRIPAILLSSFVVLFIIGSITVAIHLWNSPEQRKLRAADAIDYANQIKDKRRSKKKNIMLSGGGFIGGKSAANDRAFRKQQAH
jgi:hypothetical protein